MFFISLIRLFTILLYVDAAVLDFSNMPSSICGYPSLHTTGRFPEWNTRLAQYLLGFSLNDTNYSIDGIFSSETTADIESFQKLYGLEVNGYLNIDTWPSLLSTVTPLNIGSQGTPVMALQDVLTANGYVIEITGEYDQFTADVLAKFQLERGASISTGNEVDEQTWHLLTTQCNSTTSDYYWFDAGWPQDKISLETFQCLLDTGFKYTTIECWREKDMGSFWYECVSNIENAWQVGFEAVDVYMYPERFSSAQQQAEQLLANLTMYNVKYNAIMLDVEGDDWNSFTQLENQQYMQTLRSTIESHGKKVFVYSSSVWNTYFGTNFTAFSDTPLVYAHYDNVPSFYDYDFAPYGGWEVASGKQFWDGVEGEVVCGISLDWDWSPTPFWRNL